MASARIKFGTIIDKELKDKLVALSEETLIPKSKLMDKAITLLLKEYGKL